MTLEEIMEVLLPGCPDAGFPSFNGIGGIKHLEVRDAPLVSSLRRWAEPFGSEAQASPEEIAKSFDANDFRRIRDSILEIYFSDPKVVRAIRNVDGPLFPAGADVEQIDFDLLDAVFRRGKIYRDIL